MGLKDSLRDAVIRHIVKGEGMKKVWDGLSGWKTWIWAVVVAAKMWFPGLPIWDTIDAAAKAIGWDSLLPAVDPGQLVQWVAFAIATGHKLWKTIKPPVE